MESDRGRNAFIPAGRTENANGWRWMRFNSAGATMTTRPATPPKATSVIGDKEWNRRANAYPRLVEALRAAVDDDADWLKDAAALLRSLGESE
jgi:hypothetical protein